MYICAVAWPHGNESLVRVVASAASFPFAHVHAVTFDRMQFSTQQNSRAHAYVAMVCRVSVCASRTRSRPSDPQKSNSMILRSDRQFVVRCVRDSTRRWSHGHWETSKLLRSLIGRPAEDGDYDKGTREGYPDPRPR